jgi:hypothetical protein
VELSELFDPPLLFFPKFRFDRLRAISRFSAFKNSTIPDHHEWHRFLGELPPSTLMNGRSPPRSNDVVHPIDDTPTRQTQCHDEKTAEIVFSSPRIFIHRVNLSQVPRKIWSRIVHFYQNRQNPSVAA